MRATVGAMVVRLSRRVAAGVVLALAVVMSRPAAAQDQGPGRLAPENRALLERDSAEWRSLDALCTIPVSRFWRDRTVFEQLEREVLPALARAARGAGRDALECWSAGCAGGEEPYTLAILWHARLRQRFPALRHRRLG